MMKTTVLPRLMKASQELFAKIGLLLLSTVPLAPLVTEFLVPRQFPHLLDVPASATLRVSRQCGLELQCTDPEYRSIQAWDPSETQGIKCVRQRRA